MSKTIKNEGRKEIQLQAELFAKRTVKINKSQFQDMRMNAEIFDSLVHGFKEVYNKLDVLRKEYKDHFDYTNLKLHGVASLVYDSDKYRHADFSFFCEMEYLNFQDYLFEKDARLDYIGRSSSFYVTCDNVNIDMIDKIDNHDTETLLYDCVEKIGMWNHGELECLINGVATYENILGCRDAIGIIKDELEQLDEFVSVTLPENLATIQEVYEYIQNFKDNQIKIFKDFTSNE